jgi:hypothetical protein
MAEADKINLDNVIARLLEGMILEKSNGKCVPSCLSSIESPRLLVQEIRCGGSLKK